MSNVLTPELITVFLKTFYTSFIFTHQVTNYRNPGKKKEKTRGFQLFEETEQKAFRMAFVFSLE